MNPQTLVKRPAPKLLSLVFPVYNEEATIPFLRKELEAWRSTLHVPTEVILVDDGSRDRSRVLLSEWAYTDTTIKVIGFSANFGHQAAVTAGLQFARGEAIAILDADLQDPLDIIPEMIARYVDGFDVVYGQRVSREGESLFKRITAWGFYRLMRKFVHKDLPTDTGDFRLVSRRCLDAILQMPETHRFLRGMFAWVGFPQIAVQYRRRPREHGETKYPLSKMLRFAWNAALSFSVAPIKVISFTGLGVATFGLCYGAYSIARHFIWRDTAPGWTTLVVLLALASGAILVALGVIGEYVARIYEEVKRRPIFIIQEKLNTEQDSQ
jgi:dolichol-phosphate mannosyltransferase